MFWVQRLRLIQRGGHPVEASLLPTLRLEVPLNAWMLCDPPTRHSCFSSDRINLSPFTKDFRGEEQQEIVPNFLMPCLSSEAY